MSWPTSRPEAEYLGREFLRMLGEALGQKDRLARDAMSRSEASSGLFAAPARPGAGDPTRGDSIVYVWPNRP